jgi:hypothetical protein
MYLYKIIVLFAYLCVSLQEVSTAAGGVVFVFRSLACCDVIIIVVPTSSSL